MQSSCIYKTSDGRLCGRTISGSRSYCSLHDGCESEPSNPDFEETFAALLDAKNGDWRGFVFPRGVKLPKQLDFPIDARGCQFNALDLDGVVFKGTVDFTEAVFNNGAAFRSVFFEDTVAFERCRFNGPVDFLNVRCRKSASFLRADFTGRSILRVNFQGSANFNQVIFRDGVSFSGWRNVSLQVGSAFSVCMAGSATITTGRKPTVFERIRKIMVAIRSWASDRWKELKQQVIGAAKQLQSRYRNFLRQFAKADPNSKIFRMFETEGQLQDVVFLKPDQTTFSQVDLSHVYFRGTNLRGVRFLGVVWWQPKLKRNGLYDELFIRLSKDGPFRHQNLPVLEETCRNARVAMEENRSFGIASDFYVGEMEAARTQLSFLKRHLFSVVALYHFVSNYGTNVWSSLRVLALLYALHFSLTLDTQSVASAALSVDAISVTALHSFKVLMQQSPSTFNSVGLNFQEWLDAAFRVFGLIQVAMVALAFRSRIKRH